MTVKDSIPEDARIVEERMSRDDCSVTRILLEDQGRPVLFEDLDGGRALGNRFSTRDSMTRALNIPREGLVEHIMNAVSSPVPCEEVSDPEFRQVSMRVDLTELPIPRYYPKDGGRYISSGVIVTEYEGIRNVSFHRMMVMGPDTIAVRLVPRHLFTIRRMAKERGEELRVSICIGARAEVLLAGATSMDFGADELEIASSMHLAGHGTPLRVGRCDNGLLVPADCDYVLEGRITLEETTEGPFVDITGTYDFERQQPIIRIDRVWSCKDPIMHLLLPGGWEHYLLMGLPREPMILRAVRQAVPGVRNVRLTEGGCCWLNGVVSIRTNRAGDGVNAGMAALSGHASMKQVVVVDDDIDIFDDREVEWAVATRLQADHIVKIPYCGGSSLDPSSHGRTTWKVIYDATIEPGADRSLYEKARLDRPCTGHASRKHNPTFPGGQSLPRSLVGRGGLDHGDVLHEHPPPVGEDEHIVDVLHVTDGDDSVYGLAGPIVTLDLVPRPARILPHVLLQGGDVPRPVAVRLRSIAAALPKPHRIPSIDNVLVFKIQPMWHIRPTGVRTLE